MTEKDVDIVNLTGGDIDKKMSDFGDLLQSISRLDDKRRALWREIYENAISDRHNAYAIFAKLVRISKDNSTEHAVHGKNITGCIERMSKANDQLIRLAELITKAEENSESNNVESLFEQINAKH